MLKTYISIAVCLIVFVAAASAQNKTPVDKTGTPSAPKTLKKSNQRPAAPAKQPSPEPFDKATV